MTTQTDFSTRGQAIEKRDDVSGAMLVFKPNGTNYELHLRQIEARECAMNEPTSAVIRATARKVYTVPSGGNFISPIFGPPKIIQGRVKFVNAKQVVLHAGANFVIELPPADSSIDLNNGSINVGSLVNVVALPGATIEFAA